MFIDDFFILEKKIEEITKNTIEKNITCDCISLKKIESLNKLLDNLILYYKEVDKFKDKEIDKASGFLKYIHKSVLEVNSFGIETSLFLDMLKKDSSLNSIVPISNISNINHYISDGNIILTSSLELSEMYNGNNVFDFDLLSFKIKAKGTNCPFVTFLKINNVVGVKNVSFLVTDENDKIKSFNFSVKNKKVSFLKIATKVKRISVLRTNDKIFFSNIEVLYTKKQNDTINSFIVYNFSNSKYTKFKIESAFKFSFYLMKKSDIIDMKGIYLFIEKNKDKLIKIQNVFEIDSKIDDYILVSFFSTDKKTLDKPKVFSI